MYVESYNFFLLLMHQPDCRIDLEDDFAYTPRFEKEFTINVDSYEPSLFHYNDPNLHWKPKVSGPFFKRYCSSDEAGG